MLENKTHEEQFREHAKTYLLCFSKQCPLREHCLHSLLNEYANKTNLVVTASVNLNNPRMQTDKCPHFAKDEPIEMPVGIAPIYHDMPGWMERKIKGSLIDFFCKGIIFTEQSVVFLIRYELVFAVIMTRIIPCILHFIHPPDDDPIHFEL